MNEEYRLVRVVKKERPPIVIEDDIRPEGRPPPRKGKSMSMDHDAESPHIRGPYDPRIAVLLLDILEELRFSRVRQDHGQATMILSAEILEEMKRIRMLLEKEITMITFER